MVMLYQEKNSYESVLMEHIRMNGAYWGLTTLDLLGKLNAVDVDEVVSEVLQCQHDSGVKLIKLLSSTILNLYFDLHCFFAVLEL